MKGTNKQKVEEGLKKRGFGDVTDVVESVHGILQELRVCLRVGLMEGTFIEDTHSLTKRIGLIEGSVEVETGLP